MTDFSKDTRVKYVPAYWKDQTWKKFTRPGGKRFNTDDLETRKKFLDKELEVVQLLHKAGVPFLAGTDTPPGVYIFPGFSLHEELQRFVAAGGSTPLEALQTATLNPARFSRWRISWEPSRREKLADLVFYPGCQSPRGYSQHPEMITAVILNGKYISKADLQKILQQRRGIREKRPPTQQSSTF